MFDQFSDVVAAASTWAYLVVALFAMLDALLPVVPSETLVITAGVVAAGGDLALPLVVAAAAVGAFAGDNVGYALGYRFGPRASARFLAGERAARRVAWARRQLQRRGGELVVVGRFVPGGRTAVTLTAGMMRLPWPRFARSDILAAVLWATYAALLGYVGGKAFEKAPWKGLLVAFGVALAITIGVEGVRAVLSRGTGRVPGEGE